MEGYRNSPERHEQVNEENGEWVYEKKNGKWEQVLLPRLSFFDPSTYEEKERRSQIFLQMLHETEEQWKLDEPEVEHNQGFLRDHPRYHSLFEKWAMRYLRMKGIGKDIYPGRINPDEGQLMGPDGHWTNKRLVNVVANGREWIDENIEMELRISEGFLDITHDTQKQEELGIEAENAGWWTQDEI